MTSLVSLDVICSLLAVACFSVSAFVLASITFKANKSTTSDEAVHIISPKSERNSFIDAYSNMVGFKELEGKLLDHRNVRAVLMKAGSGFVEDTRHILSSSSFEISAVHDQEGLTRSSSQDEQRWI